MSVDGVCGVFIPDWVGAGKWQSQEEVVCPYGGDGWVDGWMDGWIDGW